MLLQCWICSLHFCSLYLILKAVLAFLAYSLHMNPDNVVGTELKFQERRDEEIITITEIYNNSLPNLLKVPYLSECKSSI